MNGELAQTIALAAHGSAWLAGVTPDPPPELERGNSTFQFVRSIRFVLRQPSFLRRDLTASTVRGWLEEARERGVSRFWLVVPEPDGDDRMLVAFAGAGTWLLLGTRSGTDGSEVWRTRFKVGDADAPDQRIWDVVYEGEPIDDVLAPPRPELPAALERLTAALAAVEGFARVHGEDRWAEWFAEARRLGAAPEPEPPYHPDMFPPGAYPASARRLLAVATKSWVFGGMGSWNDVWLESPAASDEYTRLSDELYKAMLAAFVAAVNADLVV